MNTLNENKVWLTLTHGYGIIGMCWLTGLVWDDGTLVSDRIIMVNVSGLGGA
jgi:hypothetical protein